MKNAVSLPPLITLRQSLTVVMIFIVAALLSGCGNSRTTAIATLAPPMITSAATPTPRAKTDTAHFSKNFFSAFPLVRLQISSEEKVKSAPDEKLEFLFDTGNAGLSVLDVSAAQRLGLNLTPSGSISFAGVTLPTLQARAERVQLFNHDKAEKRLLLRDVNFQVVDLTPFAELAGRRVDGILGRDVISRFVTTIDYQQQAVVFGPQTITKQAAPAPLVSATASPRPLSQSENAKPGSRIVMPFELRNGWIVVKTGINGGFEEEMILDTGASITTFSQDQARRLNFDVSRAKPTTLILPIGRLTYLPYRMREIEFGGLRLNDAASVVVSTREGLFTAGAGMSLLGANVLRHFRMTIDYGRRQLILERNDDFDKAPHEYTSIGVLPMLRDGRFFVSGVVNGSPADDEGLEIGDEIIELGGRAMNEYSFSELIDALRGPDDSRLDITVRRGQRIIDLNLKRVRLL